MSLEDWVNNVWLRPHVTSAKEIEGLLSIVARELGDSEVTGLSADGRFTHAYRAALTLATAVLYAAGYAPARGQSHHYRTIEALPLVLGTGASEDAVYLQACRAKRNAAEYDAANEVSEAEARELNVFARAFDARARAWLTRRKPAR